MDETSHLTPTDDAPAAQAVRDAIRDTAKQRARDAAANSLRDRVAAKLAADPEALEAAKLAWRKLLGEFHDAIGHRRPALRDYEVFHMGELAREAFFKVLVVGGTVAEADAVARAVLRGFATVR